MASAFDSLIGRTFEAAPCAKLNLRLKVEGRGKDGLHLLSMINVLTSLKDDLAISFEEGSGIELYAEGSTALAVIQPGEISPLQSLSDNLAVKAVKSFVERFRIPLKIKLNLAKRIPIGAGLGGGAADAGAVLRILSQVCGEILVAEKKVAKEALGAECVRIALAVGSDVPYFFRGTFARVTGVGEQVDKLDAKFLQGVKAVVVLPTQTGIIVPNSTKAVYDKFRDANPVVASTRDMKAEQYAETLRLNTEMEGYEPMPSKTIRSSLWRQLMPLVENDLESAAVGINPVLGEMLKRLRAHKDIVASVTGSGSALFILPRAQDWFDKNGVSVVKELLEGVDYHQIETSLINVATDKSQSAL